MRLRYEKGTMFFTDEYGRKFDITQAENNSVVVDFSTVTNNPYSVYVGYGDTTKEQVKDLIATLRINLFKVKMI